jgi:hypothetical protein
LKTKDEEENRKSEEEDILLELNKKTSHIADRQDEVRKLLVEYMQLFKQSDDEFPRTSRVVHAIKTNCPRPIFQTPSRIPHHLTPIVREMVEDQVKKKYYVSVYWSGTRDSN